MGVSSHAKCNRRGAVETLRMKPDSEVARRVGLGHKAKWEYFRAVYERYRKVGRETKQAMLNEFCLKHRLPPENSDSSF